MVLTRNSSGTSTFFIGCIPPSVTDPLANNTFSAGTNTLTALAASEANINAQPGGLYFKFVRAARLPRAHPSSQSDHC